MIDGLFTTLVPNSNNKCCRLPSLMMVKAICGSVDGVGTFNVIVSSTIVAVP